MSREINLENPDELTDDELWYLYTRDPVKFNRMGLTPPTPPDVPEREPAPTKGIPLEQQTVPTIGTNGGIVEDVEEDYEEGWNNNQRRAELAKRKLSVDGTKDELIARLRRSDAGELEDDDHSKVD